MYNVLIHSNYTQTSHVQDLFAFYLTPNNRLNRLLFSLLLTFPSHFGQLLLNSTDTGWLGLQSSLGPCCFLQTPYAVLWFHLPVDLLSSHMFPGRGNSGLFLPNTLIFFASTSILLSLHIIAASRSSTILTSWLVTLSMLHLGRWFPIGKRLYYIWA